MQNSAKIIGANSWLHLGCYPPCEVANNPIYQVPNPLVFSQSFFETLNLFCTEPSTETNLQTNPKL